MRWNHRLFCVLTRTILSLLVLLACSPDPCLAESLFNGAVFEVGHEPRFMIAADVNNDGKQDVITSGFSADFVPQISVLLGNGEGGFSPQVSTSTYDPVHQIASGEFNGDGLLDLVVTNRDDSTGPLVLMGNGDGSFIPGQQILLDDVFVSVAVADFDGDGRQDLALGRPFNLDIVLYFGAGDGSFSFGRSISPGRLPTTLAVEDLNADGEPDLVVGEGFPSALAVHLGVGDGTFETGFRWDIGPGFGTVALGDLNEDGAKDAVVADNGSNDVSAFVGLGDGTFLPSGRFPVGKSPIAVVIEDFNADERADIVTVNSDLFSVIGSNDLSLLAGHGDGAFGTEARFKFGHAPPRHVTTGDFDDDGDGDLATLGGFIPGAVTIAFNDGSGRLRRDIFLPMAPDPHQFAAGDLNNDGRLDLAVGAPFQTFPGGFVFIFLGGGDGSFAQVGSLGVRIPLFVQIVDLDGDGLGDVLVQDGDNDVLAFMGNGDGTFAASMGLDFPVEVLTTGDLNHDGMVDLIGARAFPTRLDVRLGNGDGTFGAPQSFPVEPDLAPFVIAISDLNGDGRQDAAVGSTGPSPGSDLGAVSVLFGIGDGTFGPSRSLGELHPVRDLAVLDFDADGNRDIAVLTITFRSGDARNLEGLTVFLGEGDGEFRPPERVFDDRLLALTVGDADGDDREDLVTTKYVSSRDGEFIVLRGGPSIANPPRFLTRDLVPENSQAGPILSLQNVIVADFNQDNRLDIAYSGDGGITVALNEGPFPNEPPVAVAAAEARVECTSPSGAEVTLDGSGSSDPDSSPGTLDDIASFEWFEDFGLASERALGTGQVVLATLPLGDHAITLRVTDSAGESAVDEIAVSVVDTTPPAMQVSLSPHVLWPPNHRMVEVEAAVSAVDACGGASFALESVTSDEEDDAPGPQDGKTRGDILGAQVATADMALELRAERDGDGDGRVYTVTYAGTDASGNSTRSSALVVVPHDQSGVTDPVEVTAREEAAGTVLEWNEVVGANHYNVVRGGVGSLRPIGDAIGLGELRCIESGSTDARSTGHEDAQRPPPGEAYFYLVEYHDGQSSSFGSEGVGLPRVKQGGGCPP